MRYSSVTYIYNDVCTYNDSLEITYVYLVITNTHGFCTDVNYSGASHAAYSLGNFLQVHYSIHIYILCSTD